MQREGALWNVLPGVQTPPPVLHSLQRDPRIADCEVIATTFVIRKLQQYDKPRLRDVMT